MDIKFFVGDLFFQRRVGRGWLKDEIRLNHSTWYKRRHYQRVEIITSITIISPVNCCIPIERKSARRDERRRGRLLRLNCSEILFHLRLVVWKEKRVWGFVGWGVFNPLRTKEATHLFSVSFFTLTLTLLPLRSISSSSSYTGDVV